MCSNAGLLSIYSGTEKSLPHFCESSWPAVRWLEDLKLKQLNKNSNFSWSGNNFRIAGKTSQDYFPWMNFQQNNQETMGTEI